MSKHLTTSQIITCLDGVIASLNRSLSVNDLDNYYYTIITSNEILHSVIDSLFDSRESARSRVRSRRFNSM